MHESILPKACRCKRGPPAWPDRSTRFSPHANITQRCIRTSMERAMKVIHAALAIACAVPVAAAARITGISIERVEPFAEGTVFGAAGSYERVIGKARGELDPQQPQNKGIVNLDKAPRNARGLAEYETDFFMLRPVDAAKGNRKILYEVNNRGRKLLMHWILDAPQQAAGANNDPKSVQDAGNALVFR